MMGESSQYLQEERAKPLIISVSFFDKTFINGLLYIGAYIESWVKLLRPSQSTSPNYERVLRFKVRYMRNTRYLDPKLTYTRLAWPIHPSNLT